MKIKLFAASAFLLCLLPSHSNAAYITVTDVKIKSYRLQWAASHLVFLVTLDKDITASGCGVSDSTDTFAYWVSGNTNDVMDRYQNFVIAAESMERKIELTYDNANCFSTTLNGAPIGGAWIAGLNMLPLSVNQ